ncbi:MAG: archaeal proteasome endopeptidase complex subunit alpha [Candidatus Bathyarchaeia archaeon]
MFMEPDERSGEESYDQAITIFSPEGRLFQVEYAFEAVNREATVVGVASSGGIVLGAEEQEGDFLDPNFNRKVFEIDEHIGAAVVGLASDANVLVEQARIYAQTDRLIYGELVDVEILAKQIGDIKQMFTQYAGVRPFGVSIIFGGIDKTGTKLFVTDPSGSCRAYKAVAIGIGREIIEEKLKKEYKEDLGLDKTVKLAVDCLVTSLKARGEKLVMKIAIIPSETRKFRILSKEKLATILNEML